MDPLTRPSNSTLARAAFVAWAQDPFEDISSDYGAQPGNVLLTTVYVLGTALHVTAIRVDPDSDEQRAADPAAQEDLDKVFALYDYAFETTEIPGFKGEFVLYAHPHGV